MADSGKKYKIFKICKELNLGHETIFSFLEQNKIKVKGKGPNAFVGEDIYLDLLERFATDKAKADTIKARRERDLTGELEEVEESIEKTEDESIYLKALKQSIVDGVEAIERSKDEKPEPKKRKRKVAPKKEEPAVPKAKRVLPEPNIEVEQIIEEPKKAIKEEKVESKEPKLKKEKDSKDAVGEPESKVSEEKLETSTKEKESKAKKGKGKSKKEEVFDETAQLTEKEKKRLKAMEMIRKDKDVKRGGRVDLAKLADGIESARRKAKPKKPKKKQVDLKEVQDTVKKTLASIDQKGKKPKKHKKVKTEDVKF